MSILSQAGSNPIPLMDAGSEKKLRWQLSLLVRAFAGLSVLTLLSPFGWTEWFKGFFLVAIVVYPWLLLLCVRFGACAVWLNSTALAPLAVLALPSILTACALMLEVIPDRGHARGELTRLMGDLRTESLTTVYHARRPVDSLHVDLFQFSVGSPEEGRELLRSRGFAPSDAALEDWEVDFQPRFFPMAWMPFSLSSDLEVWRADEATAWLDAENGEVYLVVYPGWSARTRDVLGPGNNAGSGVP